ncbi:MAG: hypothetical protein KAR45_18425, partial [Desulfobacteraceae bacterium]|nr:hypothetical protein [Desulfobacteraceae bacterium]
SITMHQYESNLLFEILTGQFLTNKNFTKIKLWSPYEKEISMQRKGKVNFNGDPSLLLILWGRASILGYCFMHGALVFIEGMYVLFMGASGVGKTTLSRLAHKAGATLLTDENPYISCEDGIVNAHTTPWPGVIGPTIPFSGPLSAIFFLRHSKKNEARQLTTAEAVRSIIGGSRTFNWIPETIPKSIQLFDKAVKNIPVYDLGFLPDLNAISYIKSIL